MGLSPKGPKIQSRINTTPNYPSLWRCQPLGGGTSSQVLILSNTKLAAEMGNSRPRAALRPPLGPPPSRAGRSASKGHRYGQRGAPAFLPVPARGGSGR